MSEARTIYECIKKCTFEGRLFERADDNKSGDKIDWPDNLIKGCVEEDCTPETREDYKVKKCRKCSDTGRSVPPHHFMPVDGVEAKREERKAKEQTEEEEKDALRVLLRKAGVEFHHSHGIVKLREFQAKFEKDNK